MSLPGWSTATGLVAGALTTGAWLPQIVQTWRTRSARDLSWAYLATMALGMGLWLAYGLAVVAPAIVITNFVTLLMLSGLAALKVRASGPRVEQEPVG
jgi:MtN3 and saliva related transmembrane protein